MTNYQTLQSRILTACQENDAICGLLLIGSRARNERPIDEHADLDYLLFTPDPAVFNVLPDWIESLGKIWIPDFGHTGPGDLEWMVIFEGGYKADFVFLKINPDQTLGEVLTTIPYQAVLARGFKVLVDKTGSAGKVNWTADAKDAPVHPSVSVFQTANDNFLMTASRAARFILRGDLWRAKFVCDGELKQMLLTMMEWHARAKNGLDYDTWYDGRYLSEWVADDVLAALPDTFGAFDSADLHRAFQATLNLYHRLAGETAEALNIPYPTPGQEAALDWLKRL